MMPIRTLIPVFLSLLLVLSGCSGPSGPSSSSGKGGYYKDDGPGNNIPADIQAIPNAVPKVERHAPANFKPYVVFGKRYVPVSDERAFRQEGTASWYGRKFHGKRTANGEIYDMYAMTAAHPTLPLPSYARVTRANTGKSVIVRINDRGPFHSSRIIDLSYVAAAKLDIIGPGSGQVIVEAITNQDIQNDRQAPQPEATPLPPAAPPPQPIIITQIEPQASTPATPNALDALQEAAAQGDKAQVDAVQADVVRVYLQFGAFSARPTADGLARQLNAQINGVESHAAHVQAAGNLYRVQIGPYPSRTAAVNAALRIQQETGQQPSVALR